jgi:16S rRNA processing protein RimM
MPSPTRDDELVELAAVVRAHGLRGELTLKPFNPDSSLLSGLERVTLKLRDGGLREYAVRTVRGHSGQLILALDGVVGRDAAETLRGAVICVPRSALPEPEEGEFYLVDLVGLEARDEGGKPIGKIEDIIDYPSISCLVVSGPAGSWEVPDTERYLAAIDLEAGFVTLANLDELDVLHTKAEG